MDDLLENFKIWAKTYDNVIPEDAIKCGKQSQAGEFNSHFGKKHTEETKRRIGAKSVNRNWAPSEITAHHGADNGRAKSVEVNIDGSIKIYGCLKDFYNEYKIIPYSSLKWMAQTQKSSRGVGVRYV